MTTLYITECEYLGVCHGLTVMAPQVPAVAEQAVALSGTSAQSAPFNAKTNFIMVNTDTACCLAFGNNPTAVTTYHRMGAGETRFYAVQPNQQLAAIQTT